MDSIIQKRKDRCYLCGNHGYGFNGLEKHHVFGGNPGRKNSEKYGLTVFLCGDSCHRNGPRSAHMNAETAQRLHEDGQKAFESVHGSREDFMRIFGKNYL